MGDEYFANLDHIESVENFKEGYESDAKCSSDSSGVDLKDDDDDNTGSEEQEESNEDSSDDNFGKDEDFSTNSVWRSYATRRQTRGQKENGLSETASKDSGLARQVSHEESAVAVSCKLPVSEETSKNKVASWLNSNSMTDSFQDNDSASSFKMNEAGEAKAGKMDAPGERERASTSGLGGLDAEGKGQKKEVSKRHLEGSVYQRERIPSCSHIQMGKLRQRRDLLWPECCSRSCCSPLYCCTITLLNFKAVLSSPVELALTAFVANVRRGQLCRPGFLLPNSLL